MHPIICTIGPFTIFSYGLMMAIAFLVSVSLAKARAKKEGLNPDLIFNFSFVVFVFGVLGARLLYVLQNLNFFLSNPLEIIMLQNGGLSWFGGLFFGSICGIVYLKIKKQSLLKILDLMVAFVALGQAIGRVGCLLNGCCYGKHSHAGIYFEVHDAVLIPTQLYSSLLLILIFIVLRFLQDKPHKTGLIFYSYLLLYAPSRFLIEFLRADNPHIIFGLTLFQVFSFFLFVVGLGGILALNKKR